MRVGLLFPGEMGAAVGRSLQAPVLWASEGRSAATAERATGFDDVGTVRELVRRSDAIVSVCPPAIAEDVAREVCALGFRGVYVEANAISPARTERIATLFERLVDGSLLGRSQTRLYLSGREEDVAEVAGLFAAGEIEAVRLAAPIGAASALKMAFAGWNKIGLTLTAQAHAIAQAYGVGEQLEAEGVDPQRLPRVAGRAWRWAPEMHEIAETCAALGLPDAIGRGAASVLDRWSGHRGRSDVPVARLLDDLLAQ